LLGRQLQVETKVIEETPVHAGIFFPLTKNLTLPATETVAEIGVVARYVAAVPPATSAMLIVVAGILSEIFLL
jgi:hypothetical protein